MRVQLTTLGCRLNEAELETWARQFQQAGYQLAEPGEAVDLLVLNTCAVTQDAVRKSRNLTRRLRNRHPGARVVLSGCHATLAPQEAEALGVDLLVGNSDKHRLVELTQTRYPPNPLNPPSSSAAAESVLFRLGRHRAFVKVQDGCRYRCSFCIVTLARGEERSRSMADIVEEVRHHCAQGIQEVVLTGVHLGGYGQDLGTHLAKLIETLLRESKIPRIRLGSLEPWDLPDGFIELFADKRLMPHLHLPLQSGSDTILRRMARRTRRHDFLNLVDRLRIRIPNLNLTTDILVGFPGEGEREWQETLSLIDTVGFGNLHVFPFSPRPGTPAANLPNGVPEAVKAARCQVLKHKAQKLLELSRGRWIGASRPVLFEGQEYRNGEYWISGYTPEYHRVFLNLADRAQGADLSYTIREVYLTGPARFFQGLEGELCSGTSRHV